MQTLGAGVVGFAKNRAPVLMLSGATTGLSAGRAISGKLDAVAFMAVEFEALARITQELDRLDAEISACRVLH